MTVTNRHGPEKMAHLSPTSSQLDTGKAMEGEIVDDQADTHLHRGLRARQVTMIALGGALGSGLLM